MANRLPLLALLLAITCPAAWAQGPAGAEFQVNSYTTNYQRDPAVASDANGNFVVVWQSRRGFDVFGQRFNASGVPQGSEFRVNSHTASYQRDPAVASDANGNFVVVWQSSYQDGSGYGVFGQRFNAGGLPLGSEFQVNSYTTSGQRLAAVASDANGNFVVVWTGYGDGSVYGVFGQRFNASGVPQASEFRVNTYVAGIQFRPAVGSDANGNFVVVWESNGQDGSSYGVFGQRFHAFGLPLASEFQVNSYTTSRQGFPAVASDANGNFVVVWESDGQDGSNLGVFGQRFNASGVPQGGDFRANTYVAGYQFRPSVAADANGNFVVVWQSLGQDGSAFGVFGQRFNAGGLPRGPEFQVNSYITNRQYQPAVASAANGNFVAVWQSRDQDGSDYGIFGQRYGDLIFQDGFE
jgi:nitrate reductase NapAB chaperone NapD